MVVEAETEITARMGGGRSNTGTVWFKQGCVPTNFATGLPSALGLQMQRDIGLAALGQFLGEEHCPSAAYTCERRSQRGVERRPVLRLAPKSAAV